MPSKAPVRSCNILTRAIVYFIMGCSFVNNPADELVSLPLGGFWILENHRDKAKDRALIY